MKILKSRANSFIIVSTIYLITAAVGVFLYSHLNFDMWLSLLITDVICTVIVFIFSIIFKNASVYDPYWSVQPIVICIVFACSSGITLASVLLIITIGFWALRLTANWAYTFYGLDHQDWRYTMLHEKTGAFYSIINLIGIHMVPTLIVYGCTLPAVYAITEQFTFKPYSIFFILLSIGAIILQGISDIQMHRYRKNRTTAFIRTGLWKHSRHPNYLGEILMWWGIGLFVVCAMPDRFYLLSGAFANTVLFLCVSIPMADKRQSKKDGFEEYKRSTRMLLPIRKFTI